MVEDYSQPSPFEYPPTTATNHTNSALVEQIGGAHYKRYAIQPVQFIEANNIPFLEACVIKRVCRHASKNGAEDIRKAIHELQLILELRYKIQPTSVDADDQGKS